MKMNRRNIGKRAHSGFTLLELMVTLAILTVVFGIVARGIMEMQQRNSVELSKVDLTQETRQFMDQITNDIHQAGFPALRMFDPSLGYTTASTKVAAGLTNVTSTEVDFEGDVDGTGQVSVVKIQLVIPAGGCPCTIQRGTIPKPGATPLFYTEVDNVMNTSVFTAYKNDGSVVTLPASASDLLNIKAIGITLWVQSTIADQKTGVFPTVTMVSQAKIDNN
jgi:prepilin-type N-terminal cleavage/methylation domain-containing protein